MRFRRMLAGAVIAATALVPLAGMSTAGATTSTSHTTTDNVIPIVLIDRHDPTVAHVFATYRCTIADPVNHPGHLWVSVKQNDAGRFDPALAAEESGGSGTATRWEDSHRNPVNCDGRLHLGAFTVDKLEGKQALKNLKRGLAWVQFCLFDDTTPQGNGTTDFGQPVSSMKWAIVL